MFVLSETRAVRRIGSITVSGQVYDLAMNGEAMLALEEPDIYGRPSARRVDLNQAAGVDWSLLCQELLNLLAVAMLDRDAALARVHKTGEEAK